MRPQRLHTVICGGTGTYKTTDAFVIAKANFLHSPKVIYCCSKIGNSNLERMIKKMGAVVTNKPSFNDFLLGRGTFFFYRNPLLETSKAERQALYDSIFALEGIRGMHPGFTLIFDDWTSIERGHVTDGFVTVVTSKRQIDCDIITIWHGLNVPYFVWNYANWLILKQHGTNLNRVKNDIPEFCYPDIVRESALINSGKKDRAVLRILRT